MRDAAGELADGFHLLRLAQRGLGRLARFVFGLKFARSFAHALFERVREGQQIERRAFALRDVGVDADDPDRALPIVVEDDVARLHPFDLAAIGFDDAELDRGLAGFRRESMIEQIDDARPVFAMNRREPGFIPPIERAEPIEREEIRRQAHRLRLNLPFEEPHLSRRLGEIQHFLVLTEQGRTGLIGQNFVRRADHPDHPSVHIAPRAFPALITSTAEIPLEGQRLATVHRGLVGQSCEMRRVRRHHVFVAAADERIRVRDPHHRGRRRVREQKRAVGILDEERIRAVRRDGIEQSLDIAMLHAFRGRLLALIRHDASTHPPRMCLASVIALSLPKTVCRGRWLKPHELVMMV